MGQKTYSKLVRDKIPEIIESNGCKCVTRVLDNAAYLEILNTKLQEEVTEYLESEQVEELADLTEVIYAIVEANGMHLDDFEELRLKKQHDRGGFHNRIMLESVFEADHTTEGDVSEGAERRGHTYFIGIDLAFSAKNDSGVVVLAGDKNLNNLKYIGSRLCKSDEEITGFIIPYLVPGQSVVAVDAPLVVPNETGMRTCERTIGQMFGSKGCSAYPAHKGNMAGTRGPNLLAHLEERGVPVYVCPTMNAGHPYVHFMETYPHVSHLALFGLHTVWKYKKKSGRTWDSCRRELTMYWRELWRILPGVGNQMIAVAESDPLGQRFAEWVPAVQKGSEPPEVIGVKYKEFEDLTDGLFCAYVAAHLHAGMTGLLFSSDSPGLTDFSKYEPGQDFIVVPSK